ncbi:MAG: hypothetical protein ACTSUE_02770 [Promethearchaeota archaeon]
MLKKVSLDTGLINLFFSPDCPNKIDDLFNSIKKGKINGNLTGPVLTESYKHLCIAKGKQYAQACVAKILEGHNIILHEIDKSLILKAGALKCRYRKELSYVDCFVIGLALLNKFEVHSTESFPVIPGAKFQKYDF